MGYRDFTLGLESAGEGAFRVRISSPAGEGGGLFQPPWDRAGWEAMRLAPCSMLQAARDVARSSPPGDRTLTPQAIGEQLSRLLFQGRVSALFQRSLGQVRGEGGEGLCLRLRFDPADADAAALGALPWELLVSPDGGFLGLDRSTLIVRYLEVDRPVMTSRVDGPLRVLVVISDPEGTAQLDLEEEKRRIEESWSREADVAVDFLLHPTMASLRDALLNRSPHVLHYMGHGTFDGKKGEGALLFEREDGRAEPVAGRVLARLLGLPNPPALVVLNACHTGRPAPRYGADPFAGIATALVKEGLLAVVAMQCAISDQAAIAFSGALYRRMAAGDAVDTAVTEGRLAIYAADSSSWEWAVPVLFLRAPAGRVLEVPRVSPQVTQQIRDFSDYIEEKTREFVGRKFVFAAVEQFAGGHPCGYFFVRGDPGIGKTALLAEMAKRKGHIHHFNIRTRNIASTADFLRNVCAQLIARHRLGFSSLPPEATRDSGFLMALLGEVSKRLREGERIFILVDALDEADRAGLAPRVNTLCLPDTLPAGIFFVVTSRRDGDAQLPLRVDCGQRTLFLEHDSKDNLADVEELLRHQLAVPGIQDYLRANTLSEREFVAQMVAKSEGNFMYLHYVLPEIARDPASARSLDEIPQGLENYYDDHWQRMQRQDRQAWLSEELPVIMALTVVPEPVPLDLIADFAGVPDLVRVMAVIKRWWPFLHAERVVEGGEEETRYRLYHMSFFDFLKKKDEVEVSFRAAHERIVKALTAR